MSYGNCSVFRIPKHVHSNDTSNEFAHFTDIPRNVIYYRTKELISRIFQISSPVITKAAIKIALKHFGSPYIRVMLADVMYVKMYKKLI
jgi:hypothetical protein